MKTRNHNRLPLWSALLCLTLALTWLPPTALANGDGGVIVIRTAEDLVRLSKNCSLDTWSQGKTVRLEADIDLRGADFSPIPTFGGTFEGSGHTIYSLSLTEGASYQGLFRYVQEGAVVRDLHVSGTVSAVGEQAYLGGIAGSNEGTILDCTFRGSVTGKLQVGGIVGVNQVSGSVYRCSAEGAVTGEERTGGIAGQNSGTITGCVNRSNVNTRHPEKERSLEEGLLPSTREDALDTTTDTGGIAGFSNGVLRSCRNKGAVGYPHVGYNVGGIAGRSSGYLENCSNSGSVQGRKDVGGVAGQLAPDVRLIFSPDTVDALKDELDRLNDMVNNTLDHAEDGKNTISDRLDQLSELADAASDSVSDLSDIMSGWADDSIDTINDAADTLADTLDRLEEITGSGEDILDAMAGGMDELEDCLDLAAGILGMGEESLDNLSDAVDSLRQAVRQAKNSLAAVRQAVRDLSAALVVEDQEAVDLALELLDSGTTQFSDALEQCGAALGDITRLFVELDPEDADARAVQEALTEYLSALGGGFLSGAEAVVHIGQGIVIGAGGTRLDWEKLRENLQNVVTALKRFSRVRDELDTAMAPARDALSGFADMSGDLGDLTDDLTDAMDTLEDAVRDLGDTADQIHDLFADLADRDPVEFDKLGDAFHQAEDDLHSAVTGIGDQMDLLRDEGGDTGDTLSGDIRDLGDQFQVIADLLLDAISDVQDKEKEDLWDDVSQERIEQTTMGKARGCANQGAVEGDLNVGGVAGAMAIEVDFDPEDDIAEVGEESFDFRYETRAILQECVNSGEVTAKKDAAGGLVGRMELGYVLNCQNYGIIESTDGDYTGGIAGLSRSTIRGCWSKCALSGGSYVGGIAGYGCEIYQCVSLISVSESEGYTGSIAGDWDREDGALRANRFVSAGLAGVDGISYAGRAEPVAYETLMQEPGVPDAFRRLTLTYVTEDAVVQTDFFSYGESLADYQPPEVPEKAGYHGTWEPVGEEFVTCDHRLEAVYTPYTTTLASGIMRDRVHALVLVEGTFGGGASLRVEKLRQDSDMEQWAVTLEGAGDGEHPVRFIPPRDWADADVTLLTADGQTVRPDRQDGSYYVLTAAGDHFTIQAVRQDGPASLWRTIALAAGAALTVLAAALMVPRFQKRKPPKSGKPAKQPDGANA